MHSLIYKLISILFLLSVITVYSQYNWVKHSQPGGGYVTCLYEFKDTLLAAVDKYVYYSTNKNYFAASNWNNNTYPELYHSSDKGETWRNITGDLFNRTVNDFYFNKNKITLATFDGLWSNDSVSSILHSAASPDFELKQNFPNPPILICKCTTLW